MGFGALEQFADVLGDAVGFDGDEVVSDVDGVALGVVLHEDDATGGGEGEGLG